MHSESSAARFSSQSCVVNLSTCIPDCHRRACSIFQTVLGVHKYLNTFVSSCRNAYANYYQYIGQRVFLEELQKNGSSENVVFMDMDVLVLDSILDVFCVDYGYAVTINANSYDPVDIGVQFVHHEHYSEGIAFLQVSSSPQFCGIPLPLFSPLSCPSRYPSPCSCKSTLVRASTYLHLHPQS